MIIANDALKGIWNCADSKSGKTVGAPAVTKAFSLSARAGRSLAIAPTRAMSFEHRY